MFCYSVVDSPTGKVVRPSPKHLESFGNEEFKAMLALGKDHKSYPYVLNLSMVVLAMYRNRLPEEGV